MDQTRKRPKFRILLLGYGLLWGSYFAVRTAQYLARETADGTVHAIALGHFTVESPPRSIGSDGKYKGEYTCPEIHFYYKSVPTDTGRWYTVLPESLSFGEWKAGDKTRVIFPRGRPESATIYSLGEFWFTAPYVITLLSISLFWSIGFVVAVFKPWRRDY